MIRHRLLLTFLFAFSLGVIAAVYLVRHEQDAARESVAGETATAAAGRKSAAESADDSGGNDDSGDDEDDSAPAWPDEAGTPEQVMPVAAMAWMMRRFSSAPERAPSRSTTCSHLAPAAA